MRAIGFLGFTVLLTALTGCGVRFGDDGGPSPSPSPAPSPSPGAREPVNVCAASPGRCDDYASSVNALSPSYQGGLVGYSARYPLLQLAVFPDGRLQRTTRTPESLSRIYFQYEMHAKVSAARTARIAALVKDASTAESARPFFGNPASGPVNGDLFDLGGGKRTCFNPHEDHLAQGYVCNLPSPVTALQSELVRLRDDSERLWAAADTGNVVLWREIAPTAWPLPVDVANKDGLHEITQAQYDALGTKDGVFTLPDGSYVWGGRVKAEGGSHVWYEVEVEHWPSFTFTGDPAVRDALIAAKAKLNPGAPGIPLDAASFGAFKNQRVVVFLKTDVEPERVFELEAVPRLDLTADAEL